MTGTRLLKVGILLATFACSRELARLPAGETALGIDPPSVSTAPLTSVEFTLRGGRAPYTFSCDNCELASGSGGSISSGGVYTAGARGEVVDRILVVDDAGNRVTATVNVLTQLTVVPSAVDGFPGERVTFLVVGGQPPYVPAWVIAPASGAGAELVPNPDNPALVEYRAGLTGGVTDRFTLTDAAGAVREVSIVLSRTLEVEPAIVFSEPGEEIILVASGGAPPYAFSIPQATRFAGSSVEPGSGRLAVGPRAPGVDRIIATDRFGGSVEVPVQVYTETYPIPRQTTDLVLEDMDGDGISDWVLANRSFPGYRVLHNNAQGQVTSERVVEVALSRSIYAMTVADISGPVGPDGTPDVVVVTSAMDMYVIDGASDALSPPFSLSTTSLVADVQLIAADLLEDGVPDLIVTSTENRLYTIATSAAGALSEMNAPIDTGAFAWDLLVDDFNEDDDLDIAYVVRTPSGAPSEMALVEATAPGVFPAAGSTTLLSDVDEGSSINSGDVDQDGHRDLVVAGNSGPLKVLLGVGDGTFTDGLSPPLTSFNKEFVLTDLNGDGRDDLVRHISPPDVTFLDPESQVLQVVLSMPGGWMVVDEAILQEGFGWITTGPLDSGDPPCVGFASDAEQLAVLCTGGDGRFGTAPDVYSLPGDPRAIRLDDVNNDGFTDVLIGDGNADQRFWSILGSGGRRLTAPLGIPGEPDARRPSHIRTVNIDGDAFPDIVISAQSASTTFRGNGDGTFTFLADEPSESALSSDAIVYDVNEDTFPDLVFLQTLDDAVGWRLGDGTGFFGSVSTLSGFSSPLAFAPAPDGILVADSDSFELLTSDGSGGLARTVLGGLETAVTDIKGYAPDQYVGSGVYGAALFNRTPTYSDFRLPLGNATDRVAACRIRGPTTVDLVFTLEDLGVVAVYEAVQGPQPPAARYHYDLGGQPTDVDCADLDGDGFEDVVVVNTGLREALVLWGSASGLERPPDPPPALAYGQPCDSAFECGTQPTDWCDIDDGMCHPACDLGSPDCSAEGGTTCAAVSINPSLGICLP